MSDTFHPDKEMVLVPLAHLRAFEQELQDVLQTVDSVVRVRPELARMLRLIREMDPEKTPIYHRRLQVTEEPIQHARMDSIRVGPRFAPKK